LIPAASNPHQYVISNAPKYINIPRHFLSNIERHHWFYLMFRPLSAPNIAGKLGKLSLLALSSVSLLMGGESRAASYNACGTGTPSSLNPFSIAFDLLNTGDQFQCQDKRFTIGDPSYLKATNDSTKRGVLTFEWNPFPPSPPAFNSREGDFFTMNIDFVPSLTLPATGHFDYSLEVTDTGYGLQDAGLDSNVAGNLTSPPRTVVTKTIYGDEFFDPSGVILTLTSTDGSNEPQAAIPFNPVTIWVRDSWDVASGDVLQDFKNSYRQVFTGEPPEGVPGPLPILGAGAAFGFSRRLRRRIRLTSGMGLNRTA
jgi:hypothetical protein